MPAKHGNIFVRFSTTIVRITFGFFFRVRVYGHHNIPPTGPALILSNHQSYIDPPLIGLDAGRRLVYMARDTLFKYRLGALLLSSVGAFPVRRGTSDKEAIRLAISLLEQGEALLMFPEGTRSADGHLQPIKGGFRILVRRANVPVIPVAVDGPYRSWPRTSLLPLPRQVRIIYGAPIPPETFINLDEEHAARLLTDEITRLFAQLRRLS